MSGWSTPPRWLPYLLLGLVVGALVDRVRRKPLLVGTDLARAALLCTVPLLALPDLLSVPMLIAIMTLFGMASLVNDAAHQSFLPRLLPRETLPWANARLEQSSAAAETSGPAVAGGLVSWLGAPVAVLVDAGVVPRLRSAHRPDSGRGPPARSAGRCCGRSRRAWAGCTGTACCGRSRSAPTAGPCSPRCSGPSTSRTGCWSWISVLSGWASHWPRPGSVAWSAAACRSGGADGWGSPSRPPGCWTRSASQ